MESAEASNKHYLGDIPSVKAFDRMTRAQEDMAGLFKACGLAFDILA